MDAHSDTSCQPSLLDLGAEDLNTTLGDFLAAGDEPSYRRAQIIKWLYESTPANFEGMTNLPRRLRTSLTTRFSLHPLTSKLVQRSVDGTQKFLWSRRGRGEIESVLIPDKDRVTYCVSTQVGCPVKCTFCATGYGGFQGQLSAGEIVDQVLQMRSLTGQPPTNVVFMGMGEPLLNFPALIAALRILTDERQLGFGARRLTVSTVGVPERIRELARLFPQVKLALSLHAPEDGLRSELIPLGRQYPLHDVLTAVEAHTRVTGRKATFEYVVLPDVNDRKSDAERTARLLRNIPARINLIGFNPFQGAPYRKPTVHRLLQFRTWLERGFRGPVTIRRSRGEDIAGACGQLSLKHA